MDNNYCTEKYYVWSYNLDNKIENASLPNLFIALGILVITGGSFLSISLDEESRKLCIGIMFLISLGLLVFAGYLNSRLAEKKRFMSLVVLISETGRDLVMVNIDDSNFLDMVGLGAYKQYYIVTTSIFGRMMAAQNATNRKTVSKIVRDNNYIGQLYENGTLSQVAHYIKNIDSVLFYNDYIKLTYYVNDGKKNRKISVKLYNNIDYYDNLRNMLGRYVVQ